MPVPIMAVFNISYPGNLLGNGIQKSFDGIG